MGAVAGVEQSRAIAVVIFWSWETRNATKEKSVHVCQLSDRNASLATKKKNVSGQILVR